MMVLTIDDIPYTNFTRLSVTQSIEEFAGIFSFEATDIDGTFNRDNYPAKIGSFCRVTIDDIAVLTGYVEVIDIANADDSHSVNISGRDVTCDLVDSSVPPNLNFSAQTISLEKMINDLQNLIGLDLLLINEVEGLTDFDSDTIFSLEAQGTIFEFLEPLARKKGVLLTTDGNGSIVITRGGFGGNLGKDIFNILEDGTSGNNNVISSRVTYDYSDRFQEYIGGSQSNLQALSDLDSNVDNESITNSISSVIDTKVRDTRKFYFIAEETTNAADLNTRINWEANIRKTRSRVYEATLQGHTITGGVPYWFNEKAIVIDDPMGVSERMLVQGVTFTESVADGELTTLKFVYRDAYTLLLTETEGESDTNSFGMPFVLEPPLTASDINKTIEQQTSESASVKIDQV